MKTFNIRRQQIYEVVGWLGTAFVIGSYILLSLGIIDGGSYTYHCMIFFGSIGVAIVSYIRKAYQPFAINVFFVVIAIIAILRISYFQ